MPFTTEFNTVTIEELPALSKDRLENDWRFVQILATATDTGVDVQYTFMKDTILQNSTIQNVQPEDVIPSITDNFLAAFVFENEVHDLFGVKIEGIAIDFDGKFYDLTEAEPMRVISPEFKATREKAAKAAAAKAAKAAQAAKAAAEAKAQAAEGTEVNA